MLQSEIPVEVVAVINAEHAPGDRGKQLVLPEMLKAADSPRLDGEDLDHIAVLAEADGCWPAIVVHRQTMRVVDGMHRLRAAQLRGDRNVEVRFFDGDVEEAFVAGVRANVAHGLPLTLADRKAAARRILSWQPHRSDRWIGEVTGLAAGTIAAVRRESGAGGAPEKARLGRDGRVRPLSPAEGRLRARQVIMARPSASLREIAQAAGVSPATAKKVRDEIRRGGDAVPGSLAISRPENLALAEEPGDGSGQGENVNDSAHSLDWSLHRLKKDPSLRYSEFGRTLLRRLEVLARGPDAVQSMINAVPSHCGFIIADVARECARQWLNIADSLEDRLSDQAREAQ